MPTNGKLPMVLDAHRNYDLERQGKLQQQSRKQSSTRQHPSRYDDMASDAAEGATSAQNIDVSREFVDEEAELLDVDKRDETTDAIPLSDLESLSAEDHEDIVTYQRLTINNITALIKAYKSLSSSSSSKFSIRQSVTSAAQVEVEDVHDDLNRELAFFKQSLDAVVEARQTLLKEGIPFSRPKDFFAEMVKTDEHMDKIKSRLMEDEANKRAAAEARRQRDLKKFGKQVQIAKLQEREKAKRDTLDQINYLKRKRKGATVDNTKEDDLFNIVIEDSKKRIVEHSRSPQLRNDQRVKRQKKDAKFGYGGKKRHAKSSDAKSTGDLMAFSTRKMKSIDKKSRRPGKSRRSKTSLAG